MSGITQNTLGCVISSFITKPQLCDYTRHVLYVALYPLSSPNHNCLQKSKNTNSVALYPLSSPNHNCEATGGGCSTVALYPLSSPNHNEPEHAQRRRLLRYILFHHQTTTFRPSISDGNSCVISSFITKPQPFLDEDKHHDVALYPLSSPNHNKAL